MDCESDEWTVPDDYRAPVPDDLDLVLETDAMVSVGAAMRFERIARFRVDALTRTEHFRGSQPHIIERSLRLELATAMRISERAADRLFVLFEALTERYRSMLESLAGARTTVRHTEVFVDLMPAVEARGILDRASLLAKTLLSDPDEQRTLDQARADVVTALLTDGTITDDPGFPRGVQAEMIVTVSAHALLDDDVAASHPAVVEGVGPIPISRARELCGGSKGWMRVLTHPETGLILSVGRRKYRRPNLCEDS